MVPSELEAPLIDHPSMEVAVDGLRLLPKELLWKWWDETYIRLVQ